MKPDRVLATYLIETPHSLEHAAAVIAGEQSSGTFVSVPGETNELKERFAAQVLRVEPLDTVREPSLPGSKPPRSAAGRADVPPRPGRPLVSAAQLRAFAAEPARRRWRATCMSCRSCPASG